MYCKMIHNKNIKLRELVLSNCSTRNVPSGMFFLDRRETFENTEKNQKYRELNLFHDEPPMILYTIYGCPVRCLALDLPRGNHTLHTLAKTLSKWCKIEAIRLDRCDALVTLSTFEDAVRLFLLPELKRYKISIADSFHQPDSCRLRTDTAMDSCGVIDLTKPKPIFGLCLLTNDCLFHMFGFLRIIDIIKLELFSPRLDVVLGEFYDLKYKELDLTNYSMIEKRNILESLLAHHVEHLVFYSMPWNYEDTEFLLSLMVKNCSNLKRLIVKDTYIPSDFMDKFDLKELEILKINSNMFETSTDFMDRSAEFPSLHTIILNDISNMTGEILLNMKNIRNFCLRNCHKVGYDNVRRFLLTNADSITYLNLFLFYNDQLFYEHSEKLNEQVLELKNVVDLVITPADMFRQTVGHFSLDNYTFLKPIRHLTIDLRLHYFRAYVINNLLAPFAAVNQIRVLQILENSYGYDAISKEEKDLINIKMELLKFTELRRIAFTTSVVKDIILDIVKLNTKLQILTLRFKTLSIELIQDIIAAARQLRILDVSRNGNLTPDLIPKIITQLHQEKVKRAPLTIHVFLTQINQYNAKLLSSHHTVKFELRPFPLYKDELQNFH